MRHDEVIDASEVVSRYSEVLDHSGEEDTSWFDVFLRHARAHFIEAQRLVRTDWSSISRFNYPRALRRESTISAVDGCREQFRTRIADTMVQYGRESQALDQSFPQRLISATDELAVDKLKEQMSDQMMRMDHAGAFLVFFAARPPSRRCSRNMVTNRRSACSKGMRERTCAVPCWNGHWSSDA